MLEIGSCLHTFLHYHHARPKSDAWGPDVEKHYSQGLWIVQPKDPRNNVGNKHDHNEAKHIVQMS